MFSLSFPASDMITITELVAVVITVTWPNLSLKMRKKLEGEIRLALHETNYRT